MSRNFTSRWRNGRRAASRAPWATPVRVRLPPSVLRRRVAQLRRALVSQTRGCWFESSLAYHVVEAQSVERPPETRGVAGSTPADHTARLRSSRESSRLLPGEALVGTRPGSPSGRTAMGAVSRLENGWVLGALGVRLPLLPPLEAWPSWKGSALLPRRRPQPLAGSSPAASVTAP